MDRALLERMTGAVVLVALLVLVAPALLDGRAGDATAPGGTPVVADTPESGDAGVRTEVIVLNAPRNAPPPAETERVESVIEPATESAPSSAPGPASAEPAAADRLAEARREALSVKPAARRPPTGFAVQLGGFSQRANAERYATQIKGEGYRVFVVKGVAGNDTIYRVYSGPMETRAAAGDLAGKLKSAGHSVMVVELGG